MARPPELDLARIRRYVANGVPEFARAHVRRDITVRGNSVTLFEMHPLWPPENGQEWTSRRSGQLRYNPTTTLWTLYWPDRNDRWYRWPDSQPTRNLAELFEEIDTSGVFWG